MRKYLVNGFLFAGVIAIGGLAGGCSCGDDGGDGDGDGDGDVDAAVDGPLVTATRAGTIALTQLAVVDQQLVGEADLDGAAFTVAYDDTTTLSVAPSYTDGAAGCTVFEFDASGGAGTSNEAAEVDEGLVTISNFADIGDINCAFVSAEIGYQCSPAAGATGAIGAASMSDANMGAALFTDPDADFATGVNGGSARGMTITIPDGTFPTTADNNGTFPILAVNAATQIRIGNGVAMSEVLGEAPGTDFTLTVGNGPIPDISEQMDDPYHIFATNSAQFSVGGGQESGGAIDSFSENVTPASLTAGGSGDGVTLNVRVVDAGGVDQGPFNADELPATGPLSIGCDAEADTNNCTEGGPISALIVSGRTTDGALPTGTGLIGDNTTMPDPVGTYTTFTCVYLGQKTGTISADAIAAIHAGNPTRIETRVIYAGGLINTEDDGDRVNLLAGYGVIGFTDL
jgi:hypothetical protein